MKKSLVTPLLLALLAAPVMAQEPTDQEKRIRDLEKQVQALQKKDATKAEAKAEDKDKDKDKKKKGIELRAVTDKGQLSWETADGAYKFRLTGRVQFDGLFNSDSDNRLSNGFTLRRVRIGYKAVIAKDWISELSVDFAENATDIKDAFIGYKGITDSTIQAGHFKVPFGFDTLTSSANIWFVERSYSDAWTPDRRLGFGYYYGADRWQAAADLFMQTISVDATGVDQGWGWAVRASGAPLYKSKSQALHLGLAYNMRTPDAASASSAAFAPITYAIDFSSRPEATKVSKAKFLNSGTMNEVDNVAQWAAELAGVWGPISWQGEYQETKVNRRSGNPNLSDHKFSTWYGQAAWTFNGQRTYDPSEGLFGRVDPAKGGAYELLVRYSQMDLNDLTTPDPIKGGSAKNLTFGVNYYPNYNFRVMLNYTLVDNDEYAKPKTTYGGLTNDDFNELQFRIQFSF
jgi:phosphate-selective porin OprO and OprP